MRVKKKKNIQTPNKVDLTLQEWREQKKKGTNII